MAQGGYRQPAQPAPASGPGRLARRTDGGPAQKIRDITDAPYGEAKTFRDLQQAAPLAQQPGPDVSTPAPGPAAAPVPLGAPTQNPDEPVTAGAAVGPGVGPEALGLPAQGTQQEDLAALRPYLPALELMASGPNAFPSSREFIRRLRAMVPPQ